MTLDEEQLAVLLAQVERAVGRRYRAHPWWEDLLGEARLGAWRALSRLAPESPFPPATVACKAGMWAAMAWLRTRKNPGRARGNRGRGEALPPLVPLDENQAIGEQEDDLVAVEERLRWLGALAALDADEAQAALKARLLRRIVMNGEAVAAVAREEGVGLRQCYRLRHEALATLRQRCEREGEMG